MNKKIKAAFAAAICASLLAACGSNAKRDLEGVPSKDPDSATVYNNVDEHPNLAVICIKGKAFVTANRQYKPWNREPDLDSTCGPAR